MPRWNLRPLLAPRSVAVVGASESPDSWAPEIERSLRHLGFDGELFPVNPKYDALAGLRCYPNVDPDKVQVIHNGIDTDEYAPNNDTGSTPIKVVGRIAIMDANAL